MNYFGTPVIPEFPRAESLFPGNCFSLTPGGQIITVVARDDKVVERYSSGGDNGGYGYGSSGRRSSSYYTTSTIVIHYQSRKNGYGIKEMHLSSDRRIYWRKPEEVHGVSVLPTTPHSLVQVQPACVNPQAFLIKKGQVVSLVPKFTGRSI